jgi:hypothetical protein
MAARASAVLPLRPVLGIISGNKRFIRNKAESLQTLLNQTLILNAKTPRRQDAETQRRRDAETQRRRDAEMQRCRDAEMQRCRDAEMQRCRDAEMQRCREKSSKKQAVDFLCVSAPLR